MVRYYSDLVDHPTCVYRCYDINGELLYVGLSINPRGRFEKHKRKPWWSLVEHVEFAWFDDREAAKSAERSAIHHEVPVYNITRPQMGCC